MRSARVHGVTSVMPGGSDVWSQIARNGTLPLDECISRRGLHTTFKPSRSGTSLGFL